MSKRSIIFFKTQYKRQRGSEFIWSDLPIVKWNCLLAFFKFFCVVTSQASEMCWQTYENSCTLLTRLSWPWQETEKETSQSPVLSQVTTIYSALLLFIHHWYIVFWWNNWKNYPCYSLWRSTSTQILVWKTRKGGTKLLGEGYGTHCTHFPWPAFICLSEVGWPAYLPAPTETHLTATWGEKPSPAATFSHIQRPPSYLRVTLF